MKYLLGLLVCAWVIAMGHAAFGAPFINSDLAPDMADGCSCQEGTNAPISAPLVAGKCRIDIETIAVGSHTYACRFTSSLWPATPAATGSVTAKKPGAFSAPNATVGL